jgi:cysteine desulfurase family protein (TIGR01976 family)
MGYDVARIRADFPALESGTAYFDGPGGSQTPRQVGDAVRDALLGPLSNRARTTRAERNADDIVVAARLAVADLVGGDPGGIVFGRSMTALTYQFSRALAKGWSSGDEVVVSRLDHDGNIRPWVQAAEAAGATVRWVDFDPHTGELTADDVAAVLSDRTRVVALTGASNLIGSRPPLTEIGRLVHGAGALFAVDGVHLTPHAFVDVAEIGADFYVCSPYKFLGPHCGVLAAAPTLLDTVRSDKLLPATDEVPERFEWGTLPYELLAGTTAAIDVLAGLDGGATGSRRQRLASSMAALERHEDGLRALVETGLAALPGVTVHSRSRHRTPTLLLTFAGRAAADAYRFLAQRNINAPAGSFYALEPSRRLGLGEAGGLRIGLAPYTDAEDVSRLLVGLREFTTPAR